MFALDHDDRCEPARLCPQGNLTIYEVKEAHGLLLALLEAQPPRHWQLDMSAVDEVDSAGAQLLLALHRHLSDLGGHLTLSRPNAAQLELFELLRLQALYPDVLPAPS
ncbi:MAG: STAS domain-containing protein [Pseudomonadota bacterium]